MNSIPPQALIFDCDGTLADSMPVHWRAWQVVLDRHQLHLSEERFYALGGVPSRDILRMLSAEQNRALDPEAVSREKEAAYFEVMAHVQPIECVVQIARAHHGKIPMAVASGGRKGAVNGVLTHLGIRDLFDTVVTSEDVVRQKPNPDIFLEAARRLGVAPHLCRGYEDTDLGMQAIRDAGMEAIDVRDLLKQANGCK